MDALSSQALSWQNVKVNTVGCKFLPRNFKSFLENLPLSCYCELWAFILERTHSVSNAFCCMWCASAVV